MFQSFLELALYFDNPWFVWYSINWSTESKEKFGIIAYYCGKRACFNMCIRNESLRKQLYNRLAFHLILDGREKEIIMYLDSYDNLTTAFHCMLHDTKCTEDRMLQFINNISRHPQVCEEFRQSSLTSAIYCYEKGLKKTFKALFENDLVDLSCANSAWMLSNIYTDETCLDVFLAAGPTFKHLVVKHCLKNLGVNDVVRICAKLVSNPIKIEDALRYSVSGPTEVTIENGQLIKPEHDIWNLIVEESMEKDVLMMLSQSPIPHVIAHKVALLAPMLYRDVLENIGFWSIVDAPCIHQQVFWNKLETFQQIQDRKMAE